MYGSAVLEVQGPEKTRRAFGRAIAFVAIMLRCALSGCEVSRASRMAANNRSVMADLAKKDWMLLVLSAAEGTTLSPVQLQKALFLVGENLPWAVGDNFYHFVPYNYGPFDPSVYSDAEALAADGWGTISYQPGRKFYEYAITTEGQMQAKRIKHALPSEVVKYVGSVVAWIKSVTFSELLRAIYAKYPDYARHSVFRDSGA